MEDKKYKIADLQEKSEEWKIPFSNLLAGFVLEEFMLRFSASEFKNRFLLRNGTVLGLEQYRKKNILKLDFFCEPDERIPEKLLQLYLQKKEQSPVRWKGTISSQQAGTCLELQGQFEEMKVPVTVGIHFMHLGKIWGLVERQIPFLMDETVQIEWKEFPAELVLAKQIFVILRDMELIPDMEIYREVFFILRNETLNGRHVCELLEDMCKTEEMISDNLGVVRDYSREGLLLGHLVLGVTRIQEAANDLGISGEPVLLLQHMMLSHHGEAEFGSPRKPMFPEAEALHWVDLLDARMNEMQTAIQKLKPGVFSEKIWSLDRRLYRADYDALEQDGTNAEPETEG